MIDVASMLAGTHIPVQKTKHQSTPAGGTYAVWADAAALDGPDMLPAMLRRHDITISLYESRPDERAERAIEAALDAENVMWSSSEREWAEEEQHYIVTYTFTFFEKRRISNG